MDRRLIQTAVLGSPDSDEPVVCPEGAEELEAFRLEHAADSIWCGINLPGGCGRPLITKRYDDRICHFSHIGGGGGDGHQCSAAQARGRDSADHLFIAAGLKSWLRAQGISADFTYPQPVGSAVLVHLADGRTILVHLDKQRPVPWNDQSFWEILLGLGVAAAAGVLARRGGRIVRVRLNKQPGSAPVFAVGMQTTGDGVRWFDPSELRLTDSHFVWIHQPAESPVPVSATSRPVPAQRQIVTVERTGVAASAARRGGDPARQAVLRLDGAVRDNPRQVAGAVRAVQALLDKGGEPKESGALQAALVRGREALQQQARRRTTLITRLRETHEAGRPVSDLLAQAIELVNDEDAPASERALVDAVRRDVVGRAQREQAVRREAAVRAQQAGLAIEQAAERGRRKAVGLRERAEFLADVARPVRGTLIKAAAEGRSVTWRDMQRRTGDARIGQLTHAERLEVLVLAERTTAPDKPLLSVLVTDVDDERALQLFRSLCGQLGRPLPVDDAELVEQLVIDRAKLHRSR